MNPTLFKLCLFDAFSFQRQESGDSNFRGNKARALLAYLVLQHERPVLRQQLLALLWDGYPPASAKTSLRVALTNLRQLLAPIQVVDSGRQAIQLHFEAGSFWCDALALEELLAPNHQRSAVERWAEVQRLYRGELLPGFEEINSKPFQIWLKAQRNAYRQQVEQLREQVAALSRPITNLPHMLTHLIGRQAEIRKLHSLLTTANYPLVTIVGEGGVGKTRLALAVAQALVDSTRPDEYFDHLPAPTVAELTAPWPLTPQFTDGIWFIPLSDLVAIEQADEQIAAAIGAALRVPFYRTAPLATQLIDYVREKALLLILDNFEQLLAGASFLLTLIQEARRLKLLITSRQPLHLQAEYLFRLQGLPVPDEISESHPPRKASSTGDQHTLPSVQLFRERARRVAAHFRPNQYTYADIAAICRLVDGLPLAIELAAAQIAQRPCADIRRALATNYATLTTDLNDVPSRHRSLHLVLEDSWRLLSPQEAQVLAQCSFFHGDFTAPAAAAIAGAKPAILEQLIQKSWLRARQSERYLLHEVVRQYATTKLEMTGAEQVAATAQRHSAYYLSLVSAQESMVCGLTPEVAITLMRQEFLNIQAAWRWALAHDQWDLAAQSSTVLADFYQMAGPVHTGETEFALAVHTIQTALAQASPAVMPTHEEALAKFLCAHAQMLLYLGDDAEVIRVTEQVIALDQFDRFPALVARAMWYQGRAHTRQGRLVQARERLEAGLSRARAQTAFTTQILILYQLGHLARAAANYAEANAWYTEALNASRFHHYSAAEVKILNGLASVAHGLGDYTEASRLCEAALQLARQIGDQYEAETAIGNLAILWAIRGDYATAHHYFNLALNAHQQSGNRMAQAYAMSNLSTLVNLIGDYSAAFTYAQQSLRIMQLSGFETERAATLLSLGLYAHRLGDHQAAQRYAEQGLQNSQQLRNRDKENFAWKILGHALTGLGQLPEAANAYTKSVALARALALPRLAIEPLAGLVAVTQALGGARDVVMGYVDEILAFLSEETLGSLDDPFHIYLICYQALVAYNDPRAEALLQSAYQQLQARAALISDEGMRHSFLTKVASHRTLATLAVPQADVVSPPERQAN